MAAAGARGGRVAWPRSAPPRRGGGGYLQIFSPCVCSSGVVVFRVESVARWSLVMDRSAVELATRELLESGCGPRHMASEGRKLLEAWLSLPAGAVKKAAKRKSAKKKASAGS